MYQGNDRVKQVNWLREIAGNIRSGGVGEGTPGEQMAYYVENYEMPDWFDSHDRRLLTQMVSGEV